MRQPWTLKRPPCLQPGCRQREEANQAALRGPIFATSAAGHKAAATRPSGESSKRRSAKRSGPPRSPWCTSPSWRLAAMRWPAPRRWCDGRTRAGGCSTPTRRRGSPWRRPAGSWSAPTGWSRSTYPQGGQGDIDDRRVQDRHDRPEHHDDRERADLAGQQRLPARLALCVHLTAPIKAVPGASPKNHRYLRIRCQTLICAEPWQGRWLACLRSAAGLGGQWASCARTELRAQLPHCPLCGGRPGQSERFAL
jgi:hypothetical protein